MGQFPVNPIQLIGQIMSGQNPMQLLMSIIQQNMPSNSPMFGNLTNMVQSQDAKGLELFARNLAASKGLNFDKEFADFKRNMGI